MDGVLLIAGNISQAFPADQAEKLLSYPGGSGWDLNDDRFTFTDGKIVVKSKKKADVAATNDAGSTSNSENN